MGGSEENPRVKIFAPEGWLAVRSTARQVRRPIRAVLSASRCASAPIPPHSSPRLASTHQQKKKTRYQKWGRTDGRTEKRKEGRTDKVFLARVKLLAIAIEPKLLFAAHLKYKKERRARGKAMENRLKKTGLLDGHVPGLPSGCADRIAFA